MEKSYDQLKTPTEIARELNISRETISGIIKRYEETGSIEYKSVGGDNRSKIKEHHRQFLLNAIEENNTITLEELQSKLIKEFGDIQSIGLSTLCKFLKHNAEKITLKRAAPRGKKRNGPDTHKVWKEFVMNLQPEGALLHISWLLWAISLHIKPHRCLEITGAIRP